MPPKHDEEQLPTQHETDYSEDEESSSELGLDALRLELLNASPLSVVTSGPDVDEGASSAEELDQVALELGSLLLVNTNEKGEWSCSKCTLLNSPLAPVCGACGQECPFQSTEEWVESHNNNVLHTPTTVSKKRESVKQKLRGSLVKVKTAVKTQIQAEIHEFQELKKEIDLTKQDVKTAVAGARRSMEGAKQNARRSLEGFSLFQGTREKMANRRISDAMAQAREFLEEEDEEDEEEVPTTKEKQGNPTTSEEKPRNDNDYDANFTIDDDDDDEEEQMDEDEADRIRQRALELLNM